MTVWHPPADDPEQLEYQYDALRMPGWELNRLWREDATNYATALHKAWSGGSAATEAQSHAAYVQGQLGCAAAGLLSTGGQLDLAALGGAYHLYGRILKTAQDEVKQQAAALDRTEFDAPTIAARNVETRQDYEYSVKRLVGLHLGPLIDGLGVEPTKADPFASSDPAGVEIRTGDVRTVAAAYDTLAGAITETAGHLGPQRLLIPTDPLFSTGETFPLRFEEAARALQYRVKKAVDGFHDLANGLRGACDAFDVAERAGADWFSQQQAEFEAFKKAIDHPVMLTVD
jgi:hypothetical protein